MTTLSGDETRRLTKLVGMLGSEFDGERATAAAMICKMARAKGLSPVEMLMGPQVAAYRETVAPPWEWRAPAPEPTRTDFDPERWYELPNSIDMLAQALRFPTFLSTWERGFAADLITRQADPALWSDKQRACAVKIIKAGRRAAVAAGAVS